MSKFVIEAAAAQGVTAVGVARAAVGVVPRAGGAVTELPVGSRPRPQFDQGGHPEVEVERRDVGPVVTQLLLAGAVDFFHIVVDLFDGKAVGHGFEDVADSGMGVGGAEGEPLALFADDDDADNAAGGWVGARTS